MKLNDKDLELIGSLSRMSQEALKNTLPTILKKFEYSKIINREKFLAAEGNIPIVLVAHMDTVFKAPPKDIYFDPEHEVLWSPDGLGADDRAGIFAILHILSHGYRPHVLFTCDEETGGFGASAAAAYVHMFEDVRYIIELDRQGEDDCVFYHCGNPEFQSYVESFGFKFNIGTFTDISIICPAWEVAGVNLSVGYVGEHSTNEVLHTDWLAETIGKVEDMLEEDVIPYFSYIREYGDIWFGDIECERCGRKVPKELTKFLALKDNSIAVLCHNCFDVMNPSWCTICGAPYVEYTPEIEEIALCRDCREELADESRRNNPERKK